MKEGVGAVAGQRAAGRRRAHWPVPGTGPTAALGGQTATRLLRSISFPLCGALWPDVGNMWCHERNRLPISSPSSLVNPKAWVRCASLLRHGSSTPATAQARI